MSCFYPVTMHILAGKNPDTGKNICVHQLKAGMNAIKTFQRPCGGCLDCRLAKSRYVAVRCVHEASMHENNCFLTLTHSDETLPLDLSISTRTMQLFYKRLRKHLEKEGVRIKHYSAGEYGDGGGTRPINPHYHSCLFGYDFPDKKFHKFSNGNPLYLSPTLDKIWGLGYAPIGEVTFQSAAYVARYTLKKVTGDRSEQHYQGRLPERSWSSHGLGKSWFQKWHSDVYPSDEVRLRNGTVMKPPPYYDKLLLADNPELYEELKEIRSSEINLEKNNYELARYWENGQPRCQAISEMVLESKFRVNKLDNKR
jgi:hypothetical protein